MSTSNPYAAPRGAVQDWPAEGQELADRGVRLLAAILDGIIASLMILLPASIAGVATGAFDGFGEGQSFSVWHLPLLLCAVGFIAWAWITTLLVARYGQTIAKRMLEIRVVRSDGSQASLGRIFWLRNVVNELLFVIPLYEIIDPLFIFGERRQCLHDLIADTIVVKA
ncbi:MAG TPA: RDD family protein [Rhodanobacteraceae bacterium]|nr:RDD family protein [Rhodanobacteraceae bacterium]